MAHLFDFSGKTVFVAGGTSGINLGIAEAFAQAGARVATISRSPEKVDAAVEKLKSHGGEAMGMAADVRDFGQVSQAMASVRERFGQFDVVISGAAGNFLAPAAGLSSNGFRVVVDIDLIGTFNVMRASYDHLTRPGASVINISAPQAYRAMPLQIHACAAKAGVDQVTRVLAVEWGTEGIRINSISPGPIAETEGMTRLAPTPEAEAQVTASIPLGRWGTKADIAHVAMFLSSPFGAYINGTVIPVDGGQSVAASGGRDYKAMMDNIPARG